MANIHPHLAPEPDHLHVEEKLAILLRIGKEIQKVHELEPLLGILGNLARDVLEAERCSIFLYDDKEHELWTMVAHQVREIRVPADKGVVGHAALSREVQLVADAYNDFRFNPDVDKNTGYMTRNVLAVPLLDAHGDVLGVFQALNKQQGDFSRIDVDLLVLISEYAAAALERAKLYRQIRDTQNKLVHKLAMAAEFKDEETSAHTRRVGLYSALLGKASGLKADEVEVLKTAAPMHDLGKIGIPDNILKKPGKLDEEEWQVMQRHPEIGYKILDDADNPILHTAALISRDHHEKWDGSGYPRGLKGEEISIHGRIVALADVFDALSTRRPYKEPWPLEEILDYIKSLSGKQFDPKLVELFFENLDDVILIKERYKDN